jgi:hypothetical protein
MIFCYGKDTIFGENRAEYFSGRGCKSRPKMSGANFCLGKAESLAKTGIG